MAKNSGRPQQVFDTELLFDIMVSYSIAPQLRITDVDTNSELSAVWFNPLCKPNCLKRLGMET